MTTSLELIPAHHPPPIWGGDRSNQHSSHKDGQLASAHHLPALYMSSLLYHNKPVHTEPLSVTVSVVIGAGTVLVGTVSHTRTTTISYVTTYICVCTRMSTWIAPPPPPCQWWSPLPGYHPCNLFQTIIFLHIFQTKLFHKKKKNYSKYIFFEKWSRYSFWLLQIINTFKFTLCTTYSFCDIVALIQESQGLHGHA